MMVEELSIKNVAWLMGGVILVYCECFNSGDVYEADSMEHVLLIHVQAYVIVTEEIHSDRLSLSYES